MNAQDIRVLFDLDLLLDTRLGFLRSLPTPFPSPFDFKKYRHRLSDDMRPLGFMDLDRDAFLQAYRKRTSAILPLSPMTEGIELLKQMIQGYLKERIDGPGIRSMTIDINGAPYEVDPAVKDALIDTIAYLTGDLCPIHWVSVPMDLLTPSYIRGTYQLVGMYDFDRWVTAHGERIRLHELHFVNFIVPALMTQCYDEATIKEMGFDDLGDLFTTLKTGLAPTMAIEFIPVPTFSFVDRQG